uniref:GmrSD restriction endonuclease domain-containing protein n=1 Tax=Helicobacter suis TaxID=104628 RepID=UPI00249121EE
VKKIRGWVEEVQKHLEDEKLNKDIKSALGFSKNFFKNLVRVGLLKAMDENFKENDFLHRLQNLTLLDKRSNSAIGNLIFSEKQQKIKELDDQKRLIPICTREVFRKVFSENENKNSPIFTKEDQEEYLKAIKKYLKKYGITSQKG